MALETFKQAARFSPETVELQEEMRRVAEILDQKKSVVHVIEIRTKEAQKEDVPEGEPSNNEAAAPTRTQEFDQDTIMGEG